MKTFISKTILLLFALFAFCQSKGMTKRAVKVTAKITGSATGTVNFECDLIGNRVRVSGEIRNLTSGKHGFHIHEFGDMTDGCKSMGGHFNPKKLTHGAPEDKARHIGDLGNIVADKTGVAKFDFWDKKITLNGANSIIGRGVVVHEKEDDLGKGDSTESKKTGNAGSRVGCGKIEENA